MASASPAPRWLWRPETASWPLRSSASTPRLTPWRADGLDSPFPARLSSREQAITDQAVAGLGESGYPDSHLFVVALREKFR